jgi:AcrR family transcriptional regulator
LVEIPITARRWYDRAVIQHRDKTAHPNVRDRIIAATVDLLHERGIHDLTQARVSALAGVRQSHLTYYFPTRNALLQQAVISGVASVLAAMDSVIEQPTATLEQLVSVLEQQLCNRKIPRMMAALVVASEEDPALKPWLVRFQSDMNTHMHRMLRACGLQPTELAMDVFHATLVGALQLDLAAGTEHSRQRMQAVLRAAFDALVAASAAPVQVTE